MLDKLKAKVGVVFKKKQPGPLPEGEEWKKLLKVVDSIMESTKKEREKMTVYLDRYNGKIWDEKKLEENDSRAFVNYFFSTVQQIAPMLTDNRPRWNIVARNDHMQKVASLYSNALIYLWDKFDLSNKTMLALLDAMIMKLGIMKIGFNPNAEFGGEITVDIVDPRTFFIAPGYTDPWEAPFCGIKARKPLSYIKSRFPDVDEIQACSTIGGDSVDDKSVVKFGDVHDFELEMKSADVYEVWMKDESSFVDFDVEYEEGGEKKTKKEKKQKYPFGKFVYFTPDKFLAEEPCDYMFNRAPYVFFYDYMKPHDTLGTGELDNTEAIILEYNNAFQALTNHFRRYHNPNVGIDIAANIDVETIKSTYKKGGQFYTYDSNNNPNMRSPIAPIQEPVINPIAYQLVNMIPHMIEEVSGVTEWAKGVLTTKQEKSASEASILIESSYTRVRQRVRNLEWSIKRLCWMIVTMMQQYYTEPRQFWTRQDDDVVYGDVSNSRATAENAVASPDTVEKMGKENAKISPEEQQELEDLKKITEEFGPTDPVYFDFEVTIDTNSSLPMDKQSLANLGMRLFNAKAIDAQALLDVLQWPRKDEIIGRMEQRVEERRKGSALPGAGSPSGPSPAPTSANPSNPQDLQEFMNALQNGGGK